MDEKILEEIKTLILKSTSTEFLDKHEAAALLKVHWKTLDIYRSKYWKQDIHFWKRPGDYVYNRELLIDWQQNMNDAVAHQRAIEVWRSRQLCNQPLPRGRKAAS